MNATVRISVIICTYNRCESLDRTLNSLSRVTVPSDLSWEVLVVDNNSTDHTKEAVQSFSGGQGVPVQYIFQKERGLSEARNAGLRHAKGEIISFLDDDVLIQPEWLVEVRKAFDSLDTPCIGGKAILPPNLKFPRWWDHAYDGPIGNCDLGEEVLIGDTRSVSIIGANISFRRFLFDKYGVFSPEVSRKGKNLVMGEETDFIRRIRPYGHYAAYYPNAVVYHVPSPDRMTIAYLSRWYFRRGEWEWYATKDTAFPPGMIAWFGAPRWLYRRFLGLAGKLASHALRLELRQAIVDYMQLCFHFGWLTSFIKAHTRRDAEVLADTKAF